MCPSILLGIDIKVMPLQFSHLVKSPFFGSVISRPFAPSLGVSSASHISLYIIFNHFAAVSISAFSSSPDIPSIPGALLFFSFFIAPLISSILIWLVFILLFSSPGSISMHELVGSLFNT